MWCLSQSGLQLLDGTARNLTLLGWRCRLKSCPHSDTRGSGSGCTRSIGSRPAMERFQKHSKHSWCYGTTTKFCRCNKSFAFAGKVALFTFQQHHHVPPWLMCLRQVTYLICVRFLFFGTEWNDEQVKQKRTKESTQSICSKKPGFPHDLVDRRDC